MKKKLMLILITLFSLNSLLYAECISGDCNNGHGTSKDSIGSKYVGQFKDGEFDGEGTYFWPNGAGKYVGQWKNGKMHGRGTIFYSNGNIVTGEFKENAYMGK